MIRNLKALGAAVLAVLAMGALASVAQAEGEGTEAEFTAAEYPVTFSGSNSAGTEVFSTEAGDVECASSFSGSASEASQVVEAHPEYSECEAFGFVDATVETNECNYRFELATETETGYDASVDVVCPEGQTIEIDAFTCSAEVPSQNDLTMVDLDNVEGGVSVLAHVNEIEYDVTNDGFLCPFSGTGTNNDGEYNTDPKNPLLITGSSAIDIG